MDSISTGPEGCWWILGLAALAGIISAIVWLIKGVIWLFNHVQIS